MRFLSKHFNKSNIRTFDRGFDNNQYYKYLYRFKKQQFNLEDMRVRSLNSIRNLELLITISVGYTGFVSEKCEERITVMQLIECSKRIFGTNKFIFYAVADGLFALLAKYKQGINHMIINSPKPHRLQLSIFGSQPFA